MDDIKLLAAIMAAAAAGIVVGYATRRRHLGVGAATAVALVVGVVLAKLMGAH